MLSIQHMFPLYIHAECMQMLIGRGGAAWQPALRDGGVGALRIPRQCMVILGRSCPTAPLMGPFAPHAHVLILSAPPFLPFTYTK